MNASRFTNAGGNWNNTSNAGTFHLNVNNDTSNANANIGSHFNVNYIKSPNLLKSIMLGLPQIDSSDDIKL